MRVAEPKQRCLGLVRAFSSGEPFVWQCRCRGFQPASQTATRAPCWKLRDRIVLCQNRPDSCPVTPNPLSASIPQCPEHRDLCGGSIGQTTSHPH